MAPPVISTSRGKTAGSLTQRHEEGYSMAPLGPRVAFDAPVAEGGDPEAQWRFASGTKNRRVGSTSFQRAGHDPNYRPGYGASAPGNSRSSFTNRADWDAGFKPQIAIPQSDPLAAHSWDADYSGNLNKRQPAPVLPPAAVSPTVPPATPSPGDLTQLSDPTFDQTAPAAPTPQIGAPVGAQNFRQITGLPAGQSASSTMIPGQNAPKNLSKRTRPPIDPLS